MEDAGHVLFTGPNIKDYFADAELSAERADPKFEGFGAMVPNRLARNAKTVVMQPRAYWGKLTAEQPSLYGALDASGGGELVLEMARFCGGRDRRR